MPCLRRPASASSRNTGSGASASRSSASTRCVPAPWRDDRRRSAVRARLRGGLEVTAVMAGEPRGRSLPMQRERHVAVRAHPGAPAVAALHERGPAAAVHQHDRLAPARAHVLERAARAPGAARAADPACRAARPAAAPGRRRARAATAVCMRVPALGPRGRAAADEHRPGQPRPPLGHLARVVAGVALLLVGGVVLLVDHDQPEVGERREHRRTRPDADARVPRRAAAAIRRSARRAPASSGGSRRARRSAPRSAAPSAA